MGSPSPRAANAPKGMINVDSLNSIKLKQKPGIC